MEVGQFVVPDLYRKEYAYTHGGNSVTCLCVVCCVCVCAMCVLGTSQWVLVDWSSALSPVFAGSDRYPTNPGPQGDHRAFWYSFLDALGAPCEWNDRTALANLDITRALRDSLPTSEFRRILPMVCC
jgi:hypothetical protein